MTEAQQNAKYHEYIDKKPFSGTMDTNFYAKISEAEYLNSYFNNSPNTVQVKNVTRGKIYHIYQINGFGDGMDFCFKNDIGLQEQLGDFFFEQPYKTKNQTDEQLQKQLINSMFGLEQTELPEQKFAYQFSDKIDHAKFIKISDIIHAICNSNQYPYPMGQNIKNTGESYKIQEQTLNAIINAISCCPQYEYENGKLNKTT